MTLMGLVATGEISSEEAMREDGNLQGDCTRTVAREQLAVLEDDLLQVARLSIYLSHQHSR